MLSALLAVTLLAFSPRPGDPGTVVLDLPIRPGGELANTLVICSTGELAGWWLPSGQWYEPRPRRFAHEHGWIVREKIRKACDQIWPRH